MLGNVGDKPDKTDTEKHPVSKGVLHKKTKEETRYYNRVDTGGNDDDGDRLLAPNLSGCGWSHMPLSCALGSHPPPPGRHWPYVDPGGFLGWEAGPDSLEPRTPPSPRRPAYRPW
jgi:hypothetical protein